MNRHRVIALALALVCLGQSVGAQTSVRFYVVPRIGTGATPADAFRPKYSDPDALGAGYNVSPWSALDYGLENVFLFAATVDASEHALLNAQTDVLAIPSPISSTVSALALNTVQTKLEAGNIPADWVTTAFTYQQVLSRVLRIVEFMQRFRGIFGRLFAGGATLDTRINQLPQNARQALADAAASMGADTSTILGTTLIRAALVIVADQLEPSGINFGGVVF